MFNIKYNNIKKSIRFYALFLIVGLIFIIICSALLISSVSKKAQFNGHVEAYDISENCQTNSEGKNICNPIYYYKVKGNEYSCRSKVGSSVVNRNKNVVYFMNDDPTDCMTQFDVSTSLFVIIGIILGLISATIGVLNILKVKKRIDGIKLLNQTGTLIKNVPYTLENTNIRINNIPLMKPVVDFYLPSGESIHIEGDARHDNRYRDADGMLDILIDLNNKENNFMDFSIDKIGEGPNEVYDYKSYSSQIVKDIPKPPETSTEAQNQIPEQQVQSLPDMKPVEPIQSEQVQSQQEVSQEPQIIQNIQPEPVQQPQIVQAVQPVQQEPVQQPQIIQPVQATESVQNNIQQ